MVREQKFRTKVRVWWDISSPPHDVIGSVICIGNFDGVHEGHKKVIERGRKLSDTLGGNLCVLSFLPHPRFIFRPEDFFVLTTVKDKIQKLRELRVSFLILMNFSVIKDFEPDEFCKLIYDKLRPKGVVVGYDFSFGKGAKGKPENIKRFFEGRDVRVEIQEKILLGKNSAEKKKISSSFLRNLVREGKVWEYHMSSGDFYSVLGCVVKGKGIGRELLFPTANISTTFFLPKEGVYACFVQILSNNSDKVEFSLKKAVCNIGPQPTFGHYRKTFEVLILDFSDDIYLNPIKIFFVKRIRDVKKFPSPQSLKERIEEDIKEAREILSATVFP